MNRQDEKEILVYADGMNTELIGILNSSVLRGKEIFSFEYDSSWLNNARACVLDPSLNLFEGRQFVPQGQANFGLFLDSSPDRWGRFLMNRREAQSPAYDINPVAYSDGLKLNISESDNTQSLALVKSVAPYFRISKNKSESLITEMLQVLKEWRKIASKLDISPSEQTRMASAFRLVDSG